MLESRPMMRPGCAAQLAALLAAPFASGACRQMPVPPPSLGVVTPEAAYNDDSLTLTIEATGEFRPAYRIETSSAAAAADTSGFGVALELSSATVGTPAPPRVSATHLEWPNPTRVVATLPAHIPPGGYDVVVTDPRGTRLVRVERLPVARNRSRRAHRIHQHSPAGNARRRGHRRERVVHGRRWGWASGPARVERVTRGVVHPSHDGILRAAREPIARGLFVPLSGTKSDVHGRSGLDPGRRNG